jgi:hypothetical protein
MGEAAIFLGEHLDAYAARLKAQEAQQAMGLAFLVTAYSHEDLSLYEKSMAVALLFTLAIKVLDLVLVHVTILSELYIARLRLDSRIAPWTLNRSIATHAKFLDLFAQMTSGAVTILRAYRLIMLSTLVYAVVSALLLEIYSTIILVSLMNYIAPGFPLSLIVPPFACLGAIADASLYFLSDLSSDYKSFITFIADL